MYILNLFLFKGGGSQTRTDTPAFTDYYVFSRHVPYQLGLHLQNNTLWYVISRCYYKILNYQQGSDVLISLYDYHHLNI